MKQYDNLLQKIARQLGIEQCFDEGDVDYKIRLIYSALGAIAYASLHDQQDESDANSIVHFKRRIRDTLWSYIDLYPVLRSAFTNNWESLSDELYDIFLTTGQVYHTPNWLTAASPCSAEYNGICFVRGVSPDFNCSFSGVGRYLKGSCNTLPSVTVNEMFALSSDSLSIQWGNILRTCKWSNMESETGAEYHRLTPPFHHGYWTNAPQARDCITLARTGLPGSRIYYLCQVRSGKRTFSQLPSWLTDNYGYRTISTCCLNAHGTLPPILYRVSGNLVFLHFSYLLPPPELNFMRLYSWPTGYAAFPYNFHRTMDVEVFDVFRSVLEAIGYQFAKE